MLAKLIIKNVALIEYEEIAFGEGLNVLSGETGAGKSIILDSVNFVLGAKADRSLIRHGESECMVKAEFLVDSNSKCVEILREFDVETDGEIIISRRFSDAGKNTIKVNGCTFTASMLRRVTDALVDVHGQSEHFFLLKESNQLKTLDEVVGGEITAKKDVLRALLKENAQIDEKIAVLGGNEMERGRRLDILRFQIEEITAVDLKEGEEDELISKRNKLMHMEKIITGLQEASEILGGESGVLDGLRMANRSIGAISKFDEQYAKTCEKLESLLLETEDAFETLSDMASELYFDENESEEVEARLDVIRALKRKYGVNKAAIDEYLTSIQKEFELLSDCEGQYAILTSEKEKVLKKIYAVCVEITKMRKTVGKEFCKQVVSELSTLNIAHANFEIAFNEYSLADAEKATSNGLDELSFLFSANAGEPLKPLGKIISGGEMSRFMLAIKTRLSGLNGISTYIFDEIDAGISGITAKVVAEKLAKISKTTQIIAVSHLAQIAAMSDNEFLIKKQETNERTETKVMPLNEEGKIRELIRLLGGNDDTTAVRTHAEELLAQARMYKKNLS